MPIASSASGYRAAVARTPALRPDSTHTREPRLSVVAEESGYIAPMSLWVLEHACQQLRQWQAMGLAPFRLSINVAPANFYQADFPNQVSATLERHGVPPGFIELELTERSLMKNTEEVQESLRQLNRTGIRIAIDDFGTGHSCLSYLRQFPIDVLKIDRSFGKDIGPDDNGTAICSLVMSIARSLNLEVVAEGVETANQLNFLRQNGCDLAQGFYFSKPVETQALPALLEHITPKILDGLEVGIEQAPGTATQLRGTR